MKKAINIRLDETLLNEIDAIGKEIERNRTWIIEKAVSAYMDTLDEMIADKRIDEIKLGKAHVMSLGEVAKSLGLSNV